MRDPSPSSAEAGGAPSSPGLPAERPDLLVPSDAERVLVVGPEADRVVSLAGKAWDAVTDVAAAWPEADALLLVDVLSRADDPGAILRRALDAVIPGGTLVVTAPNARSWAVVRGLLEGTWRPDPHGVVTPRDRRAFTRSALCELLAENGWRVVSTGGPLASEAAPREIEAALLAFDLRTAGLAEESRVLAHHVVARRPGAGEASVTSLEVRDGDVRLEGGVEILPAGPAGPGLTARLAEAGAAARGSVLALGATAGEARELAEGLDEWTDVVVRGAAIAFRRDALFGLGGFEGAYETPVGVIQDLVLRASLGGLHLRRLEPTPELEAADRDVFLDRHGWVQRATGGDPVPLVTEPGPRNPAGATLTVALIVKDEEEALPACLESVAPIADEVIVVDTGSTDRTVAIAREHGARVLSFPWCDDFSAARNASLDAVRTEWALVLDADERLTPEAVDRIRPALEDVSVGAYMLPLINVGEDPEGEETSVYLLRLFRARPSIRFSYRIHEQVAGAIFRFARRNGLRFARLEGATIRHVGYRPEVVEARGKLERNRRHFEAQLAQYPRDLYSWYKYADFLRECEETELSGAAIERADRILRSLPAEEIGVLPFAGEVVALRVLDLVDGGRAEEGRDAARIVASLDLDSAHAWYARGMAALETERFDEAVEAFRRCRTYDRTVAAVPIDPAITGVASLLGEARARAGQGRDDESRRLTHEAVERDPGSPRALVAWLEVAEDPEAALREVWSRHREGPNAAALRRAGAEALAIVGRPDAAASWLGETGEVEDPSLACALGEAHLHAGRLDEAYAVWAAWPDHPGCRAGAALATACRGEAPPSLDAEAVEHVRSYLVNLRRSGQRDLFEAAARACVRSRLLEGGG
jgi:tetratricopeptide (TPR) repeat protein